MHVWQGARALRNSSRGLIAVILAHSALTGVAVASEPKRLAYRFERASVAYDTTPSGVALVPADVPIFRDVLSLSTSDAEYQTNGGGTNNDIAPRCQNSMYMFGIGTADGRMYRSADGQTWEDIGATYASEMFALQDDTLILTRFDGDYTIAMRSTDHGLSWAPCLRAEDGQPFHLDTPLAWVVSFGHHQAANGTIMMAEYILPNYCKNLYRSTDSGQTWSRVFDNAGSVPFNHFHCVTKHEGLGRWIAVTGDTPMRNKVLASDDDGRTWFEWLTYGERTFQPTFLLDFGHPQRLLFGADDVWQMGWVDVSNDSTTKTIEPLITTWDGRPGMNYSFYLFEHGGMYYACNTQLAYYERNAVISVSPDLVHWGVCNSFQLSEVGVLNYIGPRAGRLHMAVQTSNVGIRHVAMTPPQVALRRGVLIQPPTTNLLTTPALSSAESLDLWSNISPHLPPGSGNQGTLAPAPGVAHSGAASVHFSRVDGQGMDIRSPGVQMTNAGGLYQGRFWIKGQGGTCVAMWELNGQLVQPPVMLGLSPTTWREVTLPPVSTTLPGSVLRIAISQEATAGAICEAYVDSLIIDRQPGGPWQEGGTPRDATRLTATESVGPAWTNIFTIVPDRMWRMLGNDSQIFLKSWVRDPDNYMALMFEPFYGNFVLRTVTDGVLVDELGVGLNRFQQGAQIRIALSVDTDKVGLMIANGSPQPPLSSHATQHMVSTDIDFRYGDALPGSDTLGFVVHDDVLYNEDLTPLQVAAAMNELTPPPCAGDLDANGLVQQADLALLLSCYGSGVCGDVDGNGATDQADLAALLANYGSVCP